MKHICIMLLSLIPSLSFPAELPFHSQSNQDSFLYNHVFKDKKNGVFVDIGALLRKSSLTKEKLLSIFHSRYFKAVSILRSACPKRSFG